MNTISQKDLQLLELIGQKPGATQREIAEKTGFSLGMVNLILRRLAKTGYIKVAGLDRHKISYLLTPSGMGEKAKRSYDYFQRTVHVYQQYLQRLDTLIDQLVAQGHRHFVVFGEGELIGLLQVALQKHGGALQYRFCQSRSDLRVNPSEKVLDCTLDGLVPAHGISVLESILNISNSSSSIIPILDEKSLTAKGEPPCFDKMEMYS